MSMRSIRLLAFSTVVAVTSSSAQLHAQVTRVSFANFSGAPMMPLSIAPGPDGTMWVAAGGANVIIRVSPSTLLPLSVIPLPSPATAPTSIAAGPEGQMWFTEAEGFRVGRVNAESQITMYPAAAPLSQPLVITPGPDGVMWFTLAGNSQIGRISLGGSISAVRLPQPAGSTFGIALGDGVLWLVSQKTPTGPASLFRVSSSKDVTRIPLPGQFSSPYSIVRGSDGAMWFTDLSGRIGRIDAAGLVTEFVPPLGAITPTNIAAGRDGSIWFADHDHQLVGRLTPARTFEFTRLPSSPYGIAIAPDGRIWVALPNIREVAVLAAPPLPAAPPVLGRGRLIGPPPRELAACTPGLVLKVKDVLDVVVDDKHVYYGAGDELARVPKDGGAPATSLVREPGSLIGLMTLDATHVFFGSVFRQTGIGKVSALRKDAAVPRVIVSDVMVPFEIVNDADYVYITSLGTPSDDVVIADGKVIRARKDGSEVKTLAGGLSRPIALAVSGNDVFFSVTDPKKYTGSLRRMSVDGQNLVTLVDDVYVESIAVDNSTVYYSASDGRTNARTISRIGRGGGSPSVMIPDVTSDSIHIISDRLYYVNRRDRTRIEAVPLTGGTPGLIRAVNFNGRFSFDSCLLYYGTHQGIERAAQ